MATTYGLVGLTLDDNNSLAALKAKGVKSSSNIYSNQNIGTLIDKVKIGDTIITLSIDRFGSVCRMVQVFEQLRAQGVAFKSVQEPYLEFRDGKELKRGVVKYLYQLGTDETTLINNIEATCKYPKYTAYLLRQIRQLCLQSVQRTFAEQGIMRRKS
jgi:hypothetical protein